MQAAAQPSLAERLDSVVEASPLSRTSTVVMLVWDLEADSCLYSRGATTVVRPASTQKLLTAVAALCLLGDSTMIRADSLGGKLRADFSMKKDTAALGEGWCWDDDNPQLNTRDTTIAMHPLRWLLRPMLKASNNLAAESVYYSIGGKKTIEEFIRQLRVITPWLQTTSLGAPLYRVADGSGLSLYNYLTPQLLVACLRLAWADEGLWATITDTLPVAGVDGTLEKRMTASNACSEVLAKTGTLSGVSSLAGYCLTQPLAFAIIINGTMRQQPARDLQDALCAEMAK